MELTHKQLTDFYLWASEGRAHELQSALEHIDPGFDRHGFASVLMGAAQFGHPECVNLLIPYADVAHDHSLCLQLAAEEGQLECVKILLPHSNPNTLAVKPLRKALEFGHNECAEFLFEWSNTNVALDVMCNEFPSQAEHWTRLFSDMEKRSSERVKQLLLEQIEDQGVDPCGRKM